jgi:predicted CXXCH cytochrome family protein
MRFKFQDSEHLLRMAVLFAAGTFAFFVAQAVLVPADFGKYGHYRAGALDTVAGKPLMYAGEQACVDCHADVVAARAPGRHARVRCESCHGPHAAHAADQAKGIRPDPATLCVRCHEKNPARPAAFPQVKSADHAGGESCTTCHQAHAPGVS